MISNRYSSIYLFRVPAFCLIFLLITASLYAQRHTTARNMGLGGGGTAYMTDFHANFINPANLVISGSSGFSFGLLNGIGAGGGGELINMSVYNEYFTTGRTINEDLTVEISEKLFGSDRDATRKLGLNALDAVLLGFSVKKGKQAFSVAVRARALASFNMSKGFFEVGLGGLSEHYFYDYKKVSVGGEFFTVGEVSAGYARQLWSGGTFGEPGSMRLSAGIAPKYLPGFSYYQLNFDSRLRISENEMLVSHIFDYQFESAGRISEQMHAYYDARQSEDSEPVLNDYLTLDEDVPDMLSPKGSGFGLDMGITYEMVMPGLSVISRRPRLLRLAFSVSDLGSVNFTENPGRFSANDHLVWNGMTIDYDRINAAHDSSFTAYTNHVFQDSIGSNMYGNFSPEIISGIKVDLTPMVNIGAAYSTGRWNIMLDLGRGFNTRATNSRHLSTVLGIEYNLLNFIPIRTGIRTGGELETSYSFGTGINLKFLEFTIGVMTVPDLINGSVNAGAAWSGLMLRF